MLKILSFSFALLFSFNADAAIRQSAAEALSYDNVVESSSITESMPSQTTSEPNTVKDNKKPEDILPTQKINLTNSNEDKITIKRDTYIEIKLKEKPNHFWDIKPSSSKIELVSDKNNKSSRILKYKITPAKKDSIYFIYFDLSDHKNRIKETKVLTIKVRR